MILECSLTPTYFRIWKPMPIYGDPAYPLRVQLQAPYRNPNTPEMQNFNRTMSTVRVSVEWLFGDITNYFRFVDFKKNLKIGMSCVEKTYLVCALFQNSLTCLYGNMTAKYFDLDPPTLQEYFQWTRQWWQQIVKIDMCRWNLWDEQW